MSFDSEAVYAAVFSKFQGLSWTPVVAGTPSQFATTSRRLLHWNDVPAEQRPSLFQVQTTEQPRQQRGLPPAWKLGIILYLYVQTNSQMQDVAPSQLLNPILRAIRTALRPDNLPEGTCTLGGLVSHAWIADSGVETSEGNLGDTEVALVPIEMLVPD